MALCESCSIFVGLHVHRDDVAVFVCNCVHMGTNVSVWICVCVSACDYQCLIVIDFIGNGMDQENLTVCMSTSIPIYNAYIYHGYIHYIRVIFNLYAKIMLLKNKI